MQRQHIGLQNPHHHYLTDFNLATKLQQLLDKIGACRLCEDQLPNGCRPVLVSDPMARILIIGQAPGTKVHFTGIPWNDRSGDRLREWLSVDKQDFYDSTKISMMPMGFCYPGKLKNGGDAAPRKECAPKWHAQVQFHLKRIQLTLLVGMHAQAYYLRRARKKTLTDTVRAWRDYGPSIIPLPHPSWRSANFLQKNEWFHTDVLPNLKHRVREIVKIS